MTWPFARGQEDRFLVAVQHVDHDDLVAFVEPDVTPADLGRLGAERRQRRAQRHGPGAVTTSRYGPGGSSFVGGLISSGMKRVVGGDGGDDLDLIVERKNFAIGSP